MMRTGLLGVLASCWGLVIYVIGLHVNFPGDAILERVRWELKEASDGSWDVEADRVGLWRFSGISLKDLTLYKVDKPRERRRSRKKDRDADTTAEPTPTTLTQIMSASRVRARVGLLPLVTGSTEISFDADLFGGLIEGRLAFDEPESELELNGSDLDLSTLPLSGENWDIGLTGIASLDTNLALNTADMRKSSGDISFEIAELMVESGSIMGFELPSTEFSEAVLNLTVDDGKATIEEGQFSSDMFSATLLGDISITGSDMGRWRMRIEVKLELDDTVDKFVQALPPFKQARDDDGKYHLVCSGSVKRVLASPDRHCREDRSVVGSRRKGSRDSRSSTRPSNRMGQGEWRDDDEKRGSRDSASSRERRLSRIRDRRDRMKKSRPEPGDEDFIDGPVFEDERFDMRDPMRNARGPDSDFVPGPPSNRDFDRLDEDGFENNMDDVFFEDDGNPNLDLLPDELLDEPFPEE